MGINAKISTKQKILNCAIDLFARKGYTETTLREIAAAVGVKEASIYNHFNSKNEILERILEEYSEMTLDPNPQRRFTLLKENPTADGILSFMRIHYPEDKKEYYIKQLYVIMQEQHRNPIVRKFVSERIIHSTEQLLKSIINQLKDYGILRQDTNADFWKELQSSILYTFASRSLLGIGDNSQGFTGMDMEEVLRKIYKLMLETCGTGN